MADLKATSYRFSVSWSRILPHCTGAINQAGVDFYSNLIDLLLENGIQPVLTMYHWDTPQACEDKYPTGSWVNPGIIDDFTYYGNVLFQNYGSRVKLWLTLNEPPAYCGRAFGPITDDWIWPPAKNGAIADKYNCVALVSKAHASVVQLARKSYPQYAMKFSVPYIISYYIPVSEADVEGANQLTTSQSDWMWGPLVTGDYPAYMRTIKSKDLDGTALPIYSPVDQNLMKGTLDFLAINYYSAQYYNLASNVAYPDDLGHNNTSSVEWQYTYPKGIRELTKLLSSYYGGLANSRDGKMEVMISECGYGSITEAFFQSVSDRVNDNDREAFFRGILASLKDAIEIDKTPVTSFIAWSLLDNLEWLTFDQVWGMVSVDQIGKTLNRSVKNSARFISEFFKDSKPIHYQLAAPVKKTAGSSLPGTVTITAKGSSEKLVVDLWLVLLVCLTFQ
jgi:beta-glucosidase